MTDLSAERTQQLAAAIYAEYEKRPVDRYPTEDSLAAALAPLVAGWVAAAEQAAARKAWDEGHASCICKDPDSRPDFNPYPEPEA